MLRLKVASITVTRFLMISQSQINRKCSLELFDKSHNWYVQIGVYTFRTYAKTWDSWPTILFWSPVLHVKHKQNSKKFSIFTPNQECKIKNCTPPEQQSTKRPLSCLLLTTQNSAMMFWHKYRSYILHYSYYLSHGCFIVALVDA